MTLSMSGPDHTKVTFLSMSYKLNQRMKSLIARLLNLGDLDHMVNSKKRGLSKF